MLPFIRIIKILNPSFEKELVLDAKPVSVFAQMHYALVPDDLREFLENEIVDYVADQMLNAIIEVIEETVAELIVQEVGFL